MNRKKPGPPQMIEVVFDVGYLAFALIAGLWLLINAQGRSVALLYGSMALALGFGDAFHLVPRIYAQWTMTMTEHRKALGFGKLMTSITMTIFYLLLFYVWQCYYGLQVTPVLTVAFWSLAALRMVLCLFPQNDWYGARPPLSWAILRNVPFAVMGGIIVVLFATTGRGASPFGYMPLAVTLSFLFYLVVVLFADRYKKLGMLMLPKTCMYIWIISMGFQLL